MSNKLTKKSATKGIVFPTFFAALVAALGVSMRKGGASFPEIVLVAVVVGITFVLVSWIFLKLWKNKQK